MTLALLPAHFGFCCHFDPSAQKRFCELVQPLLGLREAVAVLDPPQKQFDHNRSSAGPVAICSDWSGILRFAGWGQLQQKLLVERAQEHTAPEPA